MAYGQNAPFGLKPVHSINGGSWTEKTNTYYIYASNDGTSTYSRSIFAGDPVVWGTSRGATPTTNGLIGTIAAYMPVLTAGTPSTWNTNTIIGIFAGCRYTSTSTSTNNVIFSAYWPGAALVTPGTQIEAYIIDDPDVVYDIQVSTSRNGAAGSFIGSPRFPNINIINTDAGSFGSNFALNIGGGDFSTVINPVTGVAYDSNPAAGDTRTGQSAFYLDVDTSTAAGYNNNDYAKNVSTLPLKVLGYSQYAKNVAAPGMTMGTTPFLNVRVMLNNRVWSNNSTPVAVVD